MKYLLAFAFLACVPLGNWLIGNVGSCVPDGPCVIPVWPGLAAPSGVLAVGLGLVLRDFVREALGPRRTWFLVAAGAVLSALFSPPSLVVASAAAFALSETLDAWVYEPLRHRGRSIAVLLSGCVGIVADSVLFLLLAFGSLDFLAGQIVGKGWALMLATSFIWLKSKGTAA